MEINRGYYAVARRYELHVQVSLEHKIHILELTCNVLFYYIDILMTAFLTIFRRFLKIFQNCSEGHTNIPHTFSEDFQRLPKTLRGRPEDVFIIHQRIWVQFKRQFDINEIIHIFTIEDMENTSLECRMLFRMNVTCGVFSSKTLVSKINKVKIAFVEKHTLISWFLAILGVQNDVRKSACVNFFRFRSENQSTR